MVLHRDPVLGIQTGGHEDPRTRASSSEVNHGKPSFYDDTCDTPLHFCRGSQLHGEASTQLGSGRSQIGRRAFDTMDGAEGQLRTRGLKAVTDGAEGHQYTGGLCL
jgi:hypothetical protein